MAGSIEKRGKDTYRLVVFSGYNLDGSSARYTKTVHCKNKKDAEFELAKFVVDVQTGMVTNGKPMHPDTIIKWFVKYNAKFSPLK